MKCPKCSGTIPEHSRLCPACNHDVGFPNVRAAEKPEERAALEERCKRAHAQALEQGKQMVLQEFERMVQASNAVLCRSVGVANLLISSDNALFGTYWLEVDAGIRLPEDNAFDRARRAVDATFFPNYEREMRFAALTLDGRGPEAYGACSIVLKDGVVAHRASVCEENTLVFCRRRKIIVGDPPPAGFRAPWGRRCEVAAAKLYSQLSVGMTEKDFPPVLLRQAKGTDEVEFVEVHIYGSLNRRSIERLIIAERVMQVPEDALLVNSIRRKLAEVGATVEFYS